MYRNAKNVGFYMIGDGALTQLTDLLTPFRDGMPDAPAIYFIDRYFENAQLVSQLPILEWDQRIFVDAGKEPTCDMADKLAKEVKAFLNGGKPCALLAVGGGVTMDVCKWVGNLLGNEGNAADYQGCNLVKNPAPFKIAIPTISGSGSESSRSGIMCNPASKLATGMISDYSMFDQVLLDPRLSVSVPRDQYFYTGMDTFLRCIAALHGVSQDKIRNSFAEKALELLEKVFMSDEMMSEHNREMLMIASYKGGGVAEAPSLGHLLAAALVIVMGIPHAIAVCHALTVLEDIYPSACKKFSEMLKKQKIALPAGIGNKSSEEQLNALYEAVIADNKALPEKVDDKFLGKDELIARFKNM